MSRKHRRTSAKMTAIFAGISAGIVLGGGVAVASEYKTVSVTVDGATRQVQTMNRTVGQVVSDMGIKVGQYDQVIPALASQMSRNQEIKPARCPVTKRLKLCMPARWCCREPKTQKSDGV